MNQLVENCLFEVRNKTPVRELPTTTALFQTLIVSVQMMNADLRVSLQLSKISVKHVILNCTHPCLMPTKLLNYLPGICEDLVGNHCVRKVDFVFSKVDQDLKQFLESTPLRNDKSVAVLFVDKHIV